MHSRYYMYIMHKLFSFQLSYLLCTRVQVDVAVDMSMYYMSILYWRIN